MRLVRMFEAQGLDLWISATFVPPEAVHPTQQLGTSPSCPAGACRQTVKAIVHMLTYIAGSNCQEAACGQQVTPQPSHSLQPCQATVSNPSCCSAACRHSVCQESVRAVRRGDDDAWNSFYAGALAGAALTRLACKHTATSLSSGRQLSGPSVWFWQPSVANL